MKGWNWIQFALRNSCYLHEHLPIRCNTLFAYALIKWHWTTINQSLLIGNGLYLWTHFVIVNLVWNNNTPTTSTKWNVNKLNMIPNSRRVIFLVYRIVVIINFKLCLTMHIDHFRLNKAWRCQSNNLKP